MIAALHSDYPAASLPYANVRSIPNLRAAFQDLESASDHVRAGDGWRELLLSKGYRHVYDTSIARGGWEFYELRTGFWLLTVDMIAASTLLRSHSFGDKLVLSAVLEGDVGIQDPSGVPGKLQQGYCTIYGMHDGAFQTTYGPGETLKWVSIVIDRAQLAEATSLDPSEMPGCISDFISRGLVMPYRNVPLTGATALVANQILACSLRGSARRAFLTAKALELTCLSLISLQGDGEPHEKCTLSERELRRVEQARDLIQQSLDAPPTIAGLAAKVGLTRRKLQHGFRQIYGGTVGQIRDQIRIERALDLIRNSELPMIDIAMETGYDHPASFTRAFKASYGVPPMQMRRMAMEERLSAKVRSQAPKWPAAVTMA